MSASISYPGVSRAIVIDCALARFAYGYAKTCVRLATRVLCARLVTAAAIVDCIDVEPAMAIHIAIGVIAIRMNLRIMPSCDPPHGADQRGELAE